jgi:hypothetical protein
MVLLSRGSVLQLGGVSFNVFSQADGSRRQVHEGRGLTAAHDELDPANAK